MKAILKRTAGIVLALLVAAGVFAAAPSTAQAATKTKSISAAKIQNGLQYTFTNMAYNGKNSPIKEVGGKRLSFSTVQNFAVTPDGKYTFTTSECRTGSTKHTLLTRCEVPEVKGKTAEAPYQEATVLKNYGHGESIAVTQPDLTKEVYHVWVACDAKSDGFSRNIARITYEVKDGVGKIKKTVKLKNFKKANIKNKKATTFPGNVAPDRMNVAADQENNHIMFRLQFTNIGVSYVAYDLKKLNKALDKVGNNKYYKINKAVKWQKASIRCSHLPLLAFQSFDISGKKIYIAGGNPQKGAQIYEIPYKLYKNGKAKEQNLESTSKISRKFKLKLQLNVAGNVLKQKDLEIEGLKLVKEGSKLYCLVNFFQDRTPIANNIGIYRFKI